METGCLSPSVLIYSITMMCWFVLGVRCCDLLRDGLFLLDPFTEYAQHVTDILGFHGWEQVQGTLQEVTQPRK